MTNSSIGACATADPDHEPAVRVLCVDDNQDAADTLAALFEIVGFEARACYSGADALTILDEFRPDACVLDLSMPTMDGIELARHIREWAGRRHVPLVAVTALGDDNTRHRTRQAGFDLHMTKPADPDQLAAVVADIVILRGPG